MSNPSKDVVLSYQDMSCVSCNDMAIAVIDPGAQRNFPVLLHHLLSKLKMSNDSIKWLPDGRAFMITDKAKFCLNVCLLIVNSNRYEVFIECIKKYGFWQAQHDDGHGIKLLAAFYHASRGNNIHSPFRHLTLQQFLSLQTEIPTIQLVACILTGTKMRWCHPDHPPLSPALKYNASLSYLVMVGLHASLMIANQLPLGNTLSKHCSTTIETATNNTDMQTNWIQAKQIPATNFLDNSQVLTWSIDGRYPQQELPMHKTKYYLKERKQKHSHSKVNNADEKNYAIFYLILALRSKMKNFYYVFT
jgi:hypothetical protein